MSGFETSWLALREPADHAARAADLLGEAVAILAAAEDSLAVDLGCGTGSTARAFAAAGAKARWRLVDADPALLAEAERLVPGAETVRLDLAGPPHLPLAGAALVTCSALLDLVSADWLDGLAAALAGARLPLYAALTYDGRMDFDPPHPLDAAVAAAFDRHQLGDKGFGPALGPAASGEAVRRLKAAGFAVATAPSPWRLGPGEAALSRALLDGIAGAAREEGSLDDADLAEWHAWRSGQAAAGAILVGHADILAHPG